jgi:hypothetical protein
VVCLLALPREVQGEGGYRENLCHYVRVLLFWAPTMYVLHGRIKKLPVWVPVALFDLALFLWAGFTFFPKPTLRLVITVGILVGIVGLVVLGVFIYDRNPDRIKKVATYGLVPLWGPLFCVLYALIWLYERNEKRLIRLRDWFFHAHVLRVVYPWTVAIAAYIAITAVFDLKLLIGTAEILGIGLGVGSVAVGLVLVADWLKERRATRRRVHNVVPIKHSAPARALGGAASGIKVAGHFAMAKKKGICPYISFKEEKRAA